MTKQNQRKPIRELHLNTLSISEYSKLNVCSIFLILHEFLNRVFLLNSIHVVYIWSGVVLFLKFTHGLKHDLLQQILFSDVILTVFLDYSSVL